jgi:hypothetical protein
MIEKFSILLSYFDDHLLYLLAAVPVLPASPFEVLRNAGDSVQEDASASR